MSPEPVPRFRLNWKSTGEAHFQHVFVRRRGFSRGKLPSRPVRADEVCGQQNVRSHKSRRRSAPARESSPTTSGKQKRRLPKETAFCLIVTRKEEFLVLGRPGSDLLSQGLSHSTIGAEKFNGRVRDGIGFMLLARTTRPAKDKENEASSNALAFERSPRA